MAQKAILSSSTVDDLYENYEDNELLMRISKDVKPTKMRAATVSEEQMEKSITVKNIVRKGRVKKITSSLIIFKNQEQVSTDLESVHVHCSVISMGRR